MTDRELMQQALEALEWCRGEDLAWVNEPEFFTEAITALRERLAQPEPPNLACKSVQARLAAQWGYVKAEQEQKRPQNCGTSYCSCIECVMEPAQPEQEPVAWRYRGNLHEFDPSDWAEGPVTPLYTTPPRREWVGLTEEEFEVLEVKHAPPVHPDVKEDDWWEFARAIEAKLKEKNT